MGVRSWLRTNCGDFLQRTSSSKFRRVRVCAQMLMPCVKGCLWLFGYHQFMYWIPIEGYQIKAALSTTKFQSMWQSRTIIIMIITISINHHQSSTSRTCLNNMPCIIWSYYSMNRFTCNLIKVFQCIDMTLFQVKKHLKQKTSKHLQPICPTTLWSYLSLTPKNQQKPSRKDTETNSIQGLRNEVEGNPEMFPQKLPCWATKILFWLLLITTYHGPPKPTFLEVFFW